MAADANDDVFRLAVLAAVDGDIAMHYFKWCEDAGRGMSQYGVPHRGMKEVRSGPVSTKTVLNAIRTRGVRAECTKWPRGPGGLSRWTLTCNTGGYRSYVEYRFTTREDLSHFEQAADAAKVRQEMMAGLPKAKRKKRKATSDGLRI
jgi:hypothetical protein